jgi:hypothetical protein
LGVSKILSLKAKVHLFGLGELVRGALTSSQEVAVEACAHTVGLRRLWRRRRQNLRLNVVIFGDFGNSDTYGGDRPPAHAQITAALWRRPGHRPRAQASPRQKQTAFIPPWEQILIELLCSLASSIVARPPPAPIQNVYLLQVLTLIYIWQGG